MSRGGEMRKRELEMRLQRLERFVPEHPLLEQYETPANIAADVLFFAHSMGDIESRVVCDLGCGSGIFAIGARFLGAKMVIGVDVDGEALDIAIKNAENEGVSVDFILQDVKSFNTKCDTVVQNPPFGSQNRHADRPFIDKAMEIADAVYTLHLEKTASFVREYVESKGGKISHELTYEFPIRHMFGFHRKKVMKFNVKMFRIEVNG